MKKLNRGVYAFIGVIVLIMAGLVYSWSVMAGVINKELNVPQGALSFTFTLVMITFCLGGLIAGIIGKRIKPNVLVLIAAAFFAIGFILASFTKGIALLYIGFGIFAGLGSGFSYNAVMSTVSRWFPDKQGLISGVLLMGFGLSSFIVGKLFVYVTKATDVTSWRVTFRVMALIIAVVLVIASFFLVKPDSDYKVEGGKKKVIREPASDVTTKELLKSPSFYMYYIWAILTSAAGLFIVSQANGIATEVTKGAMNPSSIATVVGLISILNGVGRVIFGAVFDKKAHKVTMLLDMLVFILAGIILILAIKFYSFPLVVVGFILGGLAYGGVPPTNSAIISDFYGRTNYPVNYSLVNTNLIIASFASTIAGKLYDMTSSYLSTAFMIIGVSVVAFAFFAFTKRPTTKKDN